MWRGDTLSGHFEGQTARRLYPRLPFSVHLFTASGAAFALLAGVAIVDGDMVAAFLWLGIALIVDGLDGPIARHLSLSDRMPRWSGAALDFVIDYTTYVFLPALLLVVADVVTAPYDIAAAILIVTGGALYFADTRMKNTDGSFKGFPAVWNVIVFDILVVKPDEYITVAIVALLTVLTFVPVNFVHPIRVKRWRPLTLAVTVLWGVMAVLSLVGGLNPASWVVIGLLMTSLYLFGVSFIQQVAGLGPIPNDT